MNEGGQKDREMELIYKVGDWVEKTSGDYTFRGEVRMVGTKRSGVVRYVVENADGLMHIFSGKQLRLMQ